MSKPLLFRAQEFCLSEKQIPRFPTLLFFETSSERGERLERAFVRPKQVSDSSHHTIPTSLSSVVTPKPANGGQGKTGQRKRPGTQLFYPATSCGGKSIFVRQLRGPHLGTCP